MSACTAAEPTERPRAAGSTSAVAGSATPERVLLLDFEETDAVLEHGAQITATPSGATAEVQLAGKVTEPLTVVDGRDAGGRAIAFPGPCPATAQATCPKAVIEVEDDPTFNPGPDDFGFGGSVLLEPDQTSKGSNLVQKGFSRGGGSQWKLQVDGLDGRPSCILVGMGDDTVHQAKSDITVADASWHDVACRRDGDVLTISVDGAERGRGTVPSGLSVSPPGPLRIGGKSLKADNDQYFGTLDDVFFDAAQ